MKLTVGPLPAFVYWRRRAIVLGALAVVVIMFWTSCSSVPSKSDAGANQAGSTTSPPPSPESSPTASASVLTPTVDGEKPPAAGNAAAPPVSATPCADAELSLTAMPEMVVAPNGAYIRFSLRVKNISARDCTRDLGADHQELYLQSGTTKVWSSDACNPVHGSYVKLMQPNIEHSYDNTWNGMASNAGCTDRKAPGIGRYELFARLDTKISDPVVIQLT